MIQRLIRLGYKGEHFAAIGYSSAEVLHLEHMIWWISLTLVVTGLSAIAWEVAEHRRDSRI